MSSPRNRRRLGNATALIVVVGLGLAACSNSSDDSSADSSEATTAHDRGRRAGVDRGRGRGHRAGRHRGRHSATTDTAEPSATSEPAADAGPDLGEFQPISGVPGVTDEAIQYAVLGTGPSNPAGYCLLECYLGGVQAYFDYRNSIGGVHGRQLEITP